MLLFLFLPFFLSGEDLTEQPYKSDGIGYVQNRTNNNILFSIGDLGYVRRLVSPYKAVFYISNVGEEEVLTVRKLSVSTSPQTTVSVTGNSAIENGKRVSEKGPVRVETNAFERQLLPLGKILRQLEETDKNLDTLKGNTPDNILLRAEKRKEFEKTFLRRNQLKTTIESNSSKTEIILDMSALSKYSKTDGNVEIAVELELENEKGDRTMAGKKFSIFLGGAQSRTGIQKGEER